MTYFFKNSIQFYNRKCCLCRQPAAMRFSAFKLYKNLNFLPFNSFIIENHEKRHNLDGVFWEDWMFGKKIKHLQFNIL